mmetsp:Transcript_65231/g.123539  ORF Transcript_65231/g.123539 Transcript_65231/m.123539 type:complete len:301 (-) Transcript_65231:224-1126(-)
MAHRNKLPSIMCRFRQNRAHVDGAGQTVIGQAVKVPAVVLRPDEKQPLVTLIAAVQARHGHHVWPRLRYPPDHSKVCIAPNDQHLALNCAHKDAILLFTWQNALNLPGHPFRNILWGRSIAGALQAFDSNLWLLALAHLCPCSQTDRRGFFATYCRDGPCEKFFHCLLHIVSPCFCQRVFRFLRRLRKAFGVQHFLFFWLGQQRFALFRAGSLLRRLLGCLLGNLLIPEQLLGIALCGSSSDSSGHLLNGTLCISFGEAQVHDLLHLFEFLLSLDSSLQLLRAHGRLSSFPSLSVGTQSL